MPPHTYASSTRLAIGVLLAPPPVQLLDLAPIDAFYMLSKEYMQLLSLLPQPLKSLALDEVMIYYIAADESDIQRNATTVSGSANVQLALLTAHLNLQVTSTLTSSAVQPGNLDILFIPGPDPAITTPDVYQTFIQSHAKRGKTDIITVCTGIYPACHSGICDGMVVTGPRGLTPDLRSKFKNVKEFVDVRWTTSVLGDEKTVVHGGRAAELWVAAGITNGHDCVAAYIKAHFNTELAEVICRICDIGDRPQHYDNGQASETIWWVSRVLKAVVKGLF